jgi:hypothetical protein
MVLNFKLQKIRKNIPHVMEELNITHNVPFCMQRYQEQFVNEEYSDDELNVSDEEFESDEGSGNLDDYEEEDDETVKPYTDDPATLAIQINFNQGDERDDLEGPKDNLVYCTRCKTGHEKFFAESNHQGNGICGTVSMCATDRNWFSRGRAYNDEPIVVISTGYGSCYDLYIFGFVESKLGDAKGGFPKFLSLEEVTKKHEWVDPALVVNVISDAEICIDVCDVCIAQLLRTGNIRHYEGGDVYPLYPSVCDCCCKLVGTSRKEKINFIVFNDQKLDWATCGLIMQDQSRGYWESKNTCYIVRYGVPYPDWFFSNARVCNTCVKENVKNGTLMLEKRLKLLYTKPIPKSVIDVERFINSCRTDIQNQIYYLEIADGKKEDKIAKWRLMDMDKKKPAREDYLKRKKLAKTQLKKLRKHLELVKIMIKCHEEINKRLIL